LDKGCPTLALQRQIIFSLDHETRSSILVAREADYEQLTKKNVGIFRQRINEPAMKLGWNENAGNQDFT
jgi:hypothetical protein